jgi:hypothetical protein
MQSKTELNLKRYLLYSLPTTIVCLALCQSFTDVLGVLVVYLGTILNQVMLVASLRELLIPFVDSEGQKSNKKIILLFVGKLVILFGSLSLGVHLMGKKVLIPLINYVVLIFVLVLFGFKKRKQK